MVLSYIVIRSLHVVLFFDLGSLLLRVSIARSDSFLTSGSLNLHGSFASCGSLTGGDSFNEFGSIPII